MPTRMQLYGLDRHYGGSGKVRPEQAAERMRLLEAARLDYAAHNGRNAPLVDLLAWLREEAPDVPADAE